VTSTPHVIPIRPGANPTEWSTLAERHGLAADLLPVVSRLDARRSPYSRLAAIGKTPSRYNPDRMVVGIVGWTSYPTTAEEIAAWAREADYGICIRTRRLRAIDVDIEDAARAADVLRVIEGALGAPVLYRTRDNSSKFLVPVWVDGTIGKRVLSIPSGGAVELLADGQQFIAAGTHPSGARYTWSSGPTVPEGAFARLDLAGLDALWVQLRDALGAEDTRSKPPTIEDTTVIQHDPFARWLADNDWLKNERTGNPAMIAVRCPWEHEHTRDSGPTATVYWLAHHNGSKDGGFNCKHAHCASRNLFDFQLATGFLREFFDDLSILPEKASELPVVPTPRLRVMRMADKIAESVASLWAIKHVIPQAGLVTIYGQSSAGKTFFALDMAIALATGRAWRGAFRTKKSRVVYVAAEGEGAIGYRAEAYLKHHGMPATDIDDLLVLPGAPNLLKERDLREVVQLILDAAGGKVDVLFIDTVMAVSPGAEENSSADMGRFLAACRLMREEVAQLVIAVHHAGKDITRGQRGWSGLKGAVDAEIECARVDEDGDLRVARLTKVRDGDNENARWPYVIETVPLGKFDEDGDEIKSAVLIERDDAPAPRRAPPPAPKGEIQIALVAALGDLGDRAAREAIVARALERRPPQGRTGPRHYRISLDALIERGVIFQLPDGTISRDDPDMSVNDED
jgi:hypothetical protein